MTGELLHVQNPWWKDKELILKDKHIVTYESSTFKFYPQSLISKIHLEENGIYTLRGPRQIGKTTLIKLLIKKLLFENDVKPVNILYFSCDLIKNVDELTDLILLYKKTFVVQNEKAYIFLDEITTVSEWQKSIKFLSDSGVVESDVLILTGSSSYDLKIYSERLPGRKGVGEELVYLPISFRDYASTFDERCPDVALKDLLKMSAEDIKMLELKCSFMKKRFDIYIQTGGFPKVINEYHEKGTVSEDTIKVFFDFILGDAEKYLHSRRFLIELLWALPDIAGQKVSYNGIVKNFSIGIKSHDTIQKYLEYLSYSFIIEQQYFLDISKRVIRPKKMKKFYPLDPVIARVAENLSGKKIEMGHWLEMLVLRHLLKEKDASIFGLDLISGPYFWYSEKGKEIDFLVEEATTLTPIEVKYQAKVSPGDYITMKRVFRKGFVLTKDSIFKDQGIVGLPVWLFLSVIKQTK